MSKIFNLAYCTGNENVANEIEHNLELAGYQFNKIACTNVAGEEGLLERLNSNQHNSLILFSDNFLKSKECLKHGLEALKSLAENRRILPVIVDGRYPKEETDEFTIVPTVFERMTNVIQYMNYWQESYLDLRKLKRKAAPEDISAIDNELTEIKDISSDIGEFLRYLRGLKYYNLSEFCANDYEVFFKFSNDLSAHASLKNADATTPENDVELEKLIVTKEEPAFQQSDTEASPIPETTYANEASLVEIIEASSKELLEENKEINAPKKENALSDVETIDISDIPGMELLEKNGIQKENGKQQNDNTTLESLASNQTESKPSKPASSESSISDLDSILSAFEFNNSEPEEVKEAPSTEKDLDQIPAVQVFDSNETFDLIVDEILNEENEVYGEETQIPQTEAPKPELTEDKPIEAGTKEPEPIETEPTKSSTQDSEPKEHVDLEFLLDDNKHDTLEVLPKEEENDDAKKEEEKQPEQAISSQTSYTEEKVKEKKEEKTKEPLLPDTSSLDVQAIIAKATEKYDKGKIAEGLHILSKGNDKYPDNLKLRYLYAFSLAKYANNYAAATKQLEILLSHDPRHEDAYFLLAELAELHKDYIVAKDYYEKVASINPSYPDVYYRLGLLNLYHFENKQKAAIKYFKKAVKVDKKNPDAYYRLAILLNETSGKHWKSVKYFKKTLELEPDHIFANYDLAVLYHRLGDRGLAHNYYLRAIEINPELKTPQNEEAFKYELLEDNEDQPLPHLLEGEEDEEFNELKKDLERLEAKMLNLNPEASNVNEQATTKEEKEDKKEEVEPNEDYGNDEIKALLEEADQMAAMSPRPAAESEPVAVQGAAPAQKELKQEAIETIPATAAETKIEFPKPDTAKLAFVTGATSGIGKATAELFAKNGYRVIMTGRKADKLESLKSDLEKQYNAKIKTLTFDVRNIMDMAKELDSLEEDWKNVDILINNAGLARGKAPIHEGDLVHWDTMIDTNIKGLLYMTRAISPFMVARKSGHIINIGSSVGKEVYPEGNVYCATKFAVDGLTKAMRMDLYKHNIRVSQVCPAHVEETDFQLSRYEGDKEKASIYDDFQPLKSSDVADMIYFMATRPAYVNIQDVVMMCTQQASNNLVDRSGRKE